MRGGDSTTTFDGQNGWSAGPATLVPIPVLQFVGGSLIGARLDASLAFPSQIKQLLTDWRNGFPPITIDGKTVDVIQGKTAEGVLVKLYFDKQTGLLVRQARFTNTLVGTIATHVVFSDYRTVPGVGVKVPYQWQQTWVDGQYTVKLASVQANAAVDGARFGKPTAPAPQRAAGKLVVPLSICVAVSGLVWLMPNEPAAFQCINFKYEDCDR